MSFAASYAICRFCHRPEHVEEVRADPICRCRETPSPELVEERARHRREIEDMTACLVSALANLARSDPPTENEKLAQNHVANALLRFGVLKRQMAAGGIDPAYATLQVAECEQLLFRALESVRRRLR